MRKKLAKNNRSRSHSFGIWLASIHRFRKWPKPNWMCQKSSKMCLSLISYTFHFTRSVIANRQNREPSHNRNYWVLLSSIDRFFDILTCSNQTTQISRRWNVNEMTFIYLSNFLRRFVLLMYRQVDFHYATARKKKFLKSRAKHSKFNSTQNRDANLSFSH